MEVMPLPEAHVEALGVKRHWNIDSHMSVARFTISHQHRGWRVEHVVSNTSSEAISTDYLILRASI